jgi:hypothetical protein
LTRPKFKHEFPTLFSAKEHYSYTRISDVDLTSEELQCANDVAYDSVEAEAALCYNASFGKICTGEQFRVLFTLMNQSAQHAVENLRIRVVVQRVSPDPEQAAKEKAPKEDVLM